MHPGGSRSRRPAVGVLGNVEPSSVQTSRWGTSSSSVGLNNGTLGVRLGLASKSSSSSGFSAGSKLQSIWDALTGEGSRGWVRIQALLCILFVFSLIFMYRSGLLSSLTLGPAGSSSSSSRGGTCLWRCDSVEVCGKSAGRCECSIGFDGPHCERNVLDGCQLAEGHLIPCFLPSTCDCSLACDRYNLSRHELCFDTMKTGGGKPTWQDMLTAIQLSLPIGSADRSAAKPAQQEQRLTWLRPAEDCHASCSKRGVCGQEGVGPCSCPWFYSGEGCADVAAGCLNECSGRGECEEGVCRCEKHFFGIDCSLSLDQNQKPRIMSSPPFPWFNSPAAPDSAAPPARPLVFVYELPGYFNTWQFRHSEAIDLPEAVWLLERLLSSPHRTANPDEADFFYVPLFLRNRDWQKVNNLDAAIAYIDSNWPFWSRNGGKDHIFVASEPYGKCSLNFHGTGHPSLSSSISLTLWGYSGVMLKDFPDDASPCFNPDLDIVIPPALDAEEYSSVPIMEEHALDAERENVLLVKGRKIDIHEYSKEDSGEHVVQKVFELFESRQDDVKMRFVDSDSFEPGMDELVAVDFVLVVAPVGFNPLLVRSILAGCIPVIAQPNVVLPFEGSVIDWHRISIRVDMDILQDLPKILGDITVEEKKEMRAAMKDLWPHFVWASTTFNPFQLASKEKQVQISPLLAQDDVFSTVMKVLATRKNQ